MIYNSIYISIDIYISMCGCKFDIFERCVTYSCVIGAVNRSYRRRIEPLYSHGSMDPAMVRVEREKVDVEMMCGAFPGIHSVNLGQNVIRSCVYTDGR